LAAALLLATLLLVGGAVVVLGMAAGLDPEFDKGRSPIKLVVLQEALGAMTLLTLAATARRLPAFAREERGFPAGLLGAAILLALTWLVAYALERAS